MKKKMRIFRWAGMVLMVSLFMFFFGGCGGKETDGGRKIDEAKKHVDLALEYFEGQKMEEALNELQKAIRLDPDNADAHFYLGGFYHAVNALTTAIEEYQEVLRINPDYPRIHTTLGNVYYERGLKGWKKAAKLDQLNFWLPDTTRKLPYGNREDLVGLIEDYLDILRADTVDAETFSKLSQAHFLLAEEEYHKAIQVDSLDTTAQIYLGLTYSEQGYPDKAMAQYEILKKLNPDMAELLSAVLKQKEKEKQEIEKLKKAK
jgi:Tfp pilus assembly protein PilF